MLYTIEAICAELHNFFDTSREINNYTIEGGKLSLPFLVNGQLFRIVGSKFNDGIYIYNNGSVVRNASWADVKSNFKNWNGIFKLNWNQLEYYELTDEEFHGAIWPMNVPRSFMSLAYDISEYEASEAANPSPYLSENISGHYSYTKASATDSEWSKVFALKLRRFRKAANL